MTLSTADSTTLDTSDTDSIFARKRFPSVTGYADDPPTDLPRSDDKQIVLYPQEDTLKASIFQGWWNLTPYGVELGHLKWGSRSTNKTSVWPHFTEGAHILQGEPRVICKFCKGDLVHPLNKNSGTTSLWNHLGSEECARAGLKPPWLQAILDDRGSRANRVSFYHTDLSHLLTLLRAK